MTRRRGALRPPILAETWMVTMRIDTTERERWVGLSESCGKIVSPHVHAAYMPDHV